MARQTPQQYTRSWLGFAALCVGSLVTLIVLSLWIGSLALRRPAPQAATLVATNLQTTQHTLRTLKRLDEPHTIVIDQGRLRVPPRALAIRAQRLIPGQDMAIAIATLNILALDPASPDPSTSTAEDPNISTMAVRVDRYTLDKDNTWRLQATPSTWQRTLRLDPRRTLSDNFKQVQIQPLDATRFNVIVQPLSDP